MAAMDIIGGMFETDPPPAAAATAAVEILPVAAAEAEAPVWNEGSVVVRAIGLCRIADDLVGLFRALQGDDYIPVDTFPADGGRCWLLHRRERSMLIKIPPNLAVLASCPWAAHRLNIRQRAVGGGICELVGWAETIVSNFVAEVVGAEPPIQWATQYTDFTTFSHWIEQCRAAYKPRLEPPHKPIVFVPLDPSVSNGEAQTNRVQALTLAQLLHGLEPSPSPFVDTTLIGRDEFVGLRFDSPAALMTALNGKEVWHLRPPFSMAEQDGVIAATPLSDDAFFAKVHDVAHIVPGLALLRYRIGALMALHKMYSGASESIRRLLHSTDPSDRLTDLPDGDVVLLANLLDLDMLTCGAVDFGDAMDLDEPATRMPNVPPAVEALLEHANSAVTRKLIYAPDATKTNVLAQALVEKTTPTQVLTFFYALVMAYRLSVRLELCSPAARVLIRRRDVMTTLKWLPDVVLDNDINLEDLGEYLRVRRRRDASVPADYLTLPLDAATLILNHEPQTVLNERVWNLQRLAFDQLRASVVLTSFEQQLEMPLGGAMGETEQWLAEHQSMSVIVVPAGYAVTLPEKRMGLTLGVNGALGLFVTDREYIAAVDRVNSEESAAALTTQCLHMRITDAHVYPMDRLTRLLEARLKLGPVAADGSLEIHGCAELVGVVPDVAKPMTPALLALRHLADSSSRRTPQTEELVAQGVATLLVGKQPIRAQVTNEETSGQTAQTWLVAEAFQLSKSYLEHRRPHQIVRLTQPLLNLPEGKLHIERVQLRSHMTIDEIATLCYLIRQTRPPIALVVHAKPADMAAGSTINLLDEYCRLVGNTPIPRHRLTNYWTTADT